MPGSRSALAVAIIWFLASQNLVMGSQVPKRTGRSTDRQPAAALSPQRIFKLVSPSVVVVESLNGQGSVVTLGSGVVIAPLEPWDLQWDAPPVPGKVYTVVGRLVVTNRHVIEDGISFRVEHEGKSWPAKLIRVDPDHDLAELSVAGLNAPAVRLRNLSTLAVGEAVYAIGAPEGLELTISEGLISGLRDFGKGEIIQTSAAISPGSSGGGLFDAQGRLLGITTFYLNAGQSLNFALPAGWIADLLQRPKADAQAAGSVDKGGVGLGVQALALELAQNWDGLLRLTQNWTAKRPDNGDAWSSLGEAYNKLGHYQEAVSAEQRALLLKPGDDTVWERLGVAYDGLGKYDKAISSELKAIQLKRDDPDPLLSLGNTFVHLRRYDLATEAHLKAVQVSPTYRRAWLALGFDYCAQNQRANAILVYRKLQKFAAADAAKAAAGGPLAQLYESVQKVDALIAEELFDGCALLHW